MIFMENYSVLDGTDLILSLEENALGFSTGCKVSTSVETGERVTKEASSGKWKEKYVKSFSEEISADEEKPYKISTSDHFYIPEEMKDHAAVNFETRGTSWRLLVVIIILCIVAYFALMKWIPRLLGFLDGIIGSVR